MEQDASDGDFWSKKFAFSPALQFIAPKQRFIDGM
jgi:hypothetical protein